MRFFVASVKKTGYYAEQKKIKCRSPYGIRKD